MDDLRRLFDQALLRIVRMNLEKLTHVASRMEIKKSKKRR